jgi:hypothetical protein
MSNTATTTAPTLTEQLDAFEGPFVDANGVEYRNAFHMMSSQYFQGIVCPEESVDPPSWKIYDSPKESPEAKADREYWDSIPFGW